MKISHFNARHLPDSIPTLLDCFMVVIFSEKYHSAHAFIPFNNLHHLMYYTGNLSRLLLSRVNGQTVMKN